MNRSEYVAHAALRVGTVNARAQYAAILSHDARKARAASASRLAYVASACAVACVGAAFLLHSVPLAILALSYVAIAYKAN